LSAPEFSENPTVCAPPAEATVPPQPLSAAVPPLTDSCQRIATLFVPENVVPGPVPKHAAAETMPPAVVPGTETVSDVAEALKLDTGVPKAVAPVKLTEPPIMSAAPVKATDTVLLPVGGFSRPHFVTPPPPSVFVPDGWNLSRVMACPP
jgi:hypothetical protein